MAFELIQALQVINEALTGDDELMAEFIGGVHLNIAPQDTPFPYIVISFVTQVDVYSMAASRVLSLPIIQVKALIEGEDLIAYQTALNRLDSVLSGVRRQVDDFWCHGVTREDTAGIMFLESRDDSSSVTHIGANYRVSLSTHPTTM